MPLDLIDERLATQDSLFCAMAYRKGTPAKTISRSHVDADGYLPLHMWPGVCDGAANLAALVAAGHPQLVENSLVAGA
jgi:hypothetical protein